jgi:repressor LexA
MQAKQLTPRQREVFKFIKKYAAKHGYAPTYEDIGKAVGLSSSATIYNHIRSLEKRGYIRRQKGVSRGIDILIDSEPKQEQVIFVSVLGKITGEGPLEEYKTRNKKLVIPTQLVAGQEANSLFALDVEGSGLVSEGLLNGDCIVFKYDENVKSGGTALVVLPSSVATIRKVKIKDKRINLISATSKLHNILSEKPKFQGKVVGVYRSYL